MNLITMQTVAILPTTSNVDVTLVAQHLRNALLQMNAPTSYLNQSTVMAMLGRHAFTRMGKLKLAGWLGEKERHFRIVLYVADTAVNSPWTQTCIRQVCHPSYLSTMPDATVGGLYLTRRTRQ